MVHVLGRDRLIVGRVGADEDEQIGADPVGVGAGGGRNAEGCLERNGAGRVADAGGVIDVVGAHRPDRFLGGVVGLVGDAAAGQVVAGAVGVDVPDALRDQIHRDVPGDPGEAAIALAPDHRVGQSTELAQFGTRSGPVRRDICQRSVIEGGHRVQAEQAEADVAEMRTVERPVVQTGDPECAAIADALGEDAPGEPGLIAVFPEGAGDFGEVVGMLLADAEWLQAGPE